MKTVHIIQAMGDWLKPGSCQPRITNFYWCAGSDGKPGQFIRKFQTKDDESATQYSSREEAEQVLEQIKAEGLLPETWTAHVADIQVEEESITSPKVLLGHHSFEAAYIQPDYPYGRNLRCKRALWIETATSGSQKGRMRLCYCTTDPKRKNEAWNTHHKETYSEFLIMYFDPTTGHVMTDSPGRTVNSIELFKDKWYDQLSDELKKKFDAIEKRYKPIESLKKASIKAAVVDTATELWKLNSQEAFSIVKPILDSLNAVKDETIMPDTDTIQAELDEARKKHEPIKQAYYSQGEKSDPKLVKKHEDGLKAIAELERNLAFTKETKRKMQIARKERVVAFANKHYSAWVKQGLIILHMDSRGFEEPFTWDFENWHQKLVFEATSSGALNPEDVKQTTLSANKQDDDSNSMELTLYVINSRKIGEESKCVPFYWFGSNHFTPNVVNAKHYETEEEAVSDLKAVAQSGQIPEGRDCAVVPLKGECTFEEYATCLTLRQIHRWEEIQKQIGELYVTLNISTHPGKFYLADAKDMTSYGQPMHWMEAIRAAQEQNEQRRAMYRKPKAAPQPEPQTEQLTVQEELVEETPQPEPQTEQLTVQEELVEETPQPEPQAEQPAAKPVSRSRFRSFLEDLDLD